MASKPTHLAVVSAPAHVVQCIELANRIATTQKAVKLTVFVVSYLETMTRDSQTVESARRRNLYDVIHLPPPDISALVGRDEKAIPSMNVAMRVIKPELRSAMASLDPPATAMIFEVFAIECLDVADELKIPKYVFVSTNARALVLFLYIRVLDKEVEGEFVDLTDPIVLPGCDPIRPDDLPDTMDFRTTRNYFDYLKISTQITGVDGILVNSWEELQPAEITALRDQNLIGGIAKAPIFPVGPITLQTKQRSKTELFDWLDKQTERSVLYISFGSIGGLSQEQMTEMAWGLERSRQRFIWVLRKPTTVSGGGSGHNYYRKQEDVLSYLPEGFVTRTRNVGVVIPQWAPQVEILSHPSVGGFYTHCGWNSAIECIINGLPMIAWPLYHEQKMNAAILTEQLGIAVRPKVNPSKGLVGREEIETMVRRVMEEEEGKKIKTKVNQLKVSGEKACSEHGSSWKAITDLIRHCQKEQ